MSGLVTGGGRAVQQHRDVWAPKPIKVEMPDVEEVRRAVDAALANEEAEAEETPTVPAPRQEQQPMARPTPGVIPPAGQRGWSRVAAMRKLSGLRSIRNGRGGDTRPPTVDEVRQPASGRTAGIAAVIALIIVVLIVVFYLISSLISSISSLFG
ncbi:hypothetical protein [Herbihabitans rhizosphaerae]|uniref:hypothetical protein n=1 Tax=Herbihabitans rhizosphaerae TaxID=1872711 RepID=UPI00102CFC89|nr:hypothetical protein [Herbihabitans rhizosphaerae]